MLTETVKYFDEINTNSRGADSADEDLDNFSFVDDDGSNAISDYDKSVSMPGETIERAKRETDDGKDNERELHFESYHFDGDSDEDLSADSADSAATPNQNGGRRRNKGGNRGGGSMQRNRNNEDNDDNKESPLDKLVKDIRQKVKDTKKFWSNLPFQICNNEEIAAPTSSDANCWNGNAVDR